MELQQIESALEAGNLLVRMRNGKLLQVRRNGKTSKMGSQARRVSDSC